MAKKNKETEGQAEFNPFEPEVQDPLNVPEPGADFPGEFDTEEGINFETDFDLDGEYKPAPLAPKGNYLGMVSKVVWEGSNNALAWQVTLSDQNQGVMSDGTTPLGGQVFDYRNWFPRPGDENEMSARGRQTKRQAKINMIKEFSDKMKIDMSSPAKIKMAIQNQDWIGLLVIVSITIEQYQGRYRNSISKMVSATGTNTEQ